MKEQVKATMKQEFSKETLKKEGKGLLIKILINVGIMVAIFGFYIIKMNH